MRLIVSERGTVRSEIACGDEALHIGSRETCGLFLPDERVPEQLAVVFPDGDTEWAIQPLDQSLTMQLNGEPVAAKVHIRNGDVLTFLEYSIKLALDESARQSRATPAAPTTSVAQMARFVQAQLPQGAIVKKPDEPLTMSGAQIARIARANVSLGACNQVEELMNVAIQTLQDIFAAQRVWIGVRRVNYGAMEYVEGRNLAGQAVELPDVGDHVKPRVLDRGQFIIVPFLPAEPPLSLMVGPLPGPDGPLGMAYLDSGDTGRRFEPQEIDYFIAVLHAIGGQLDAIFRVIAKQRAATVEGEVSVVHAIQARLTPRKLPQWDELQFGAFREPGRQRTTDVYDVVRLATQHAAIMIAHTHATGPLPGMVMSQAQAAFRSAIMHNDPPHLCLRTINHLIYDGLTDRLLDCLVGVIDPKTGEMRYSVAGSMGAYVISTKGEERRLGDDTPPLGAQKAVSYPLLTEEIASEETLVLFTPGVITARNAKDEVFGRERFVNILCDGFGQLASNMLKELLSDLQHFTQGGQQPDDITVILAHRV